VRINIPEEKRREIAGHLRAAADLAEVGDVTGMASAIVKGFGVVATEADAYSKKLGFDVKGIVRMYLQKGINSVFGE